MKYIIEDNLDFKSAILQNNIINENELCLITQQPLTKSHIKLPCNHSFNYKPLFAEIYIQKTKKNLYETTKLNINQLKCPYCRNISELLLPYIQNEEKERKAGVNSPAKYCMPCTIRCEWKNKKKSKYNPDLQCSKPACYISDVSYCKTHYIKSQKQDVTHMY